MSEIIEALNQLEKEKNISKDVLLDAIEKSLKTACKRDFDTDENIDVVMDKESGEFHVYARKEVVSEVERQATQISLEKAKMIKTEYELGDVVPIEITTKDFGRIAAQRARNVIIQAINESERDAIYNHFSEKETEIITGIVQRVNPDSLTVSLDEKTETKLRASEMIPGEHYNKGDRIKLYISEVRKDPKGPKISVSRKNENMVKRLFEKEVTEIADGTVEIVAVCREAGSRSKIAVWSNDENVDAVGACVGVNGSRVNAVVDELGGEKIDIVPWDENPAIFIRNALSPSEVTSASVDVEQKSAIVIVPDFQLSLAIGKKGQNARLAARLTGYKIDIKSETQAKELGFFDESEDEYDDYDDEAYDESYDDEAYDDEPYDDEAYDDESYDDFEETKESVDDSYNEQ